MGVRAELPLMQINTVMTVGQGRHARRKRMPGAIRKGSPRAPSRPSEIGMREVGMSGCLDEVNSVRPPVGNLHGPPLDGLTGPGVALLRRGERIDPPIWRRQMQAGGYAATSIIARTIAAGDGEIK
jgi:hypothetical protein